MVVFWRGYGFIALLALVLPIGVHFFLSYPNPQSTALPVGLTFLLSAAICLVSWQVFRKKPNGPHTLYGLPLSFWALVYLGFGCYCLGTAAGIF